MNIKNIDLKLGNRSAEITATYGAGQQINVVMSHPDVSTAIGMAAVQAIKKMKSIVDREIFEAGQKEQEKQFDNYITPDPIPTLIESLDEEGT